MSPLYDGPCISIGGAPRSGTTLVRQLLMAHPDAGVLLEDRLTDVVKTVQSLASLRVEGEDGMRDIALGATRSFIGVPAVFAADGLQSLAEVEGYRARFAALLPQTIGTVLGRSAPRVLGSKLPIFAEWEDTAFLRSCLSDYRMIFIVRNPLDTINSSIARRNRTRRGDDSWPIESVADAYSQWLTAIRRVAMEMADPKATAMAIKYCDLCARPAEEEAGLRAFAGLGPSQDIPPMAYPSEARRPAMTEAELDEARELVGEPDLDALWSDLPTAALIDRFGRVAATYRMGAVVDLGVPASEIYLTGGFGVAEGWGRWTDGPLATIALRFEGRSRPARLRLHITNLYPSPGEIGAKTIDVRVNQAPPRSMTAHIGAGLEIAVPADEMLASGRCEIGLGVGTMKTALDPGADPRALGVGVSAFSLNWT